MSAALPIAITVVVVAVGLVARRRLGAGRAGTGSIPSPSPSPSPNADAQGPASSGGRGLLGFVDVALLTMGYFAVQMTVMEEAAAVPVDLVSSSRGGAATSSTNTVVVSVTPDGLFVGEQRVTPDELSAAVTGFDVLVRADRGLTAAALIDVMGALRDAQCGHVDLRVRKE